MPLAIASLTIEIILIIVTNVMSGRMYQELAIFIIVAFVLCTLTSIGCIFYNASNIKMTFVSKGVSITGLIISAIGALVGLVFCITIFTVIGVLAK